MGGGFLFLVAGGLIGYHFGKERSDPACRGSSSSWHDRWHENRRRAWAAREMALNQPVQEKNGSTAAPAQEAPTLPSLSKSWFGGINASEWKAYQEWRAQQQGLAATAGPQQNADTKDFLREAAVDSADKALDALLVQVAGLKEKLGHYKSSSPGTPATEAGEFKLV